MNSRHWWRGICLVAALGGALAAGYGAGAQNTPPAPKQTLQVGQVLRVGSRVVTAEDLVARIWDNESALPQDQRILAPSLNYLRDVAVLELEAERLQANVTTQEVTDAATQQIERVKAEVKQKTLGTITYEQWLQQQGLTKEGFENYVRDRSRVILLKRLLVTWFEETTESLEASHILVAKQSTAEELHKRLSATPKAEQAAKFEELAVQHSTDPAAGVTQGRLPRIYRNDGALVQEAADALWKLSDGEFCAPVKTQFGWHLFRRSRTFAGSAKKFAELRPELLKRPDVEDERFNRWVRWVFNTQKYEVERRLPGYDCKANELPPKKD
ncbi:MAG: peptidylprolyl isomerase [Planctomycetes bacterium]|nr:peptidylprolyl isomerase [Planctomycetota bacterium]